MKIKKIGLTWTGRINSWKCQVWGTQNLKKWHIQQIYFFWDDPFNIKKEDGLRNPYCNKKIR